MIYAIILLSDYYRLNWKVNDIFILNTPGIVLGTYIYKNQSERQHSAFGVDFTRISSKDSIQLLWLNIQESVVKDSI